MENQIKQKIHFITGKGGVGKSFFAASLAQFLANSQSFTLKNTNSESTAKNNLPVLLSELAEISFYKDFFNLNQIGFNAQKFSNFEISHWSAQDCLKEYALYLLKIESLYKLFFQNPISRALIDVAPGLQELAILGKATSLPRHHGPRLNYQHLVFDSHATGHFLSMLRAPNALANTIKFGPMGEQSRSIDAFIRNKDYCQIYIVTTPEELPITETLELRHSLISEFNQEPIIVLNKKYLLNIEDLTNEEALIQKFYLNKLEQQNSAVKILNKNKISYVEIPFIFELNSIELIQQAANFLQKQSGFLEQRFSL